MSEKINTHGMLVDFGRHKGTLYTRTPFQYLLWMVQISHSRMDVAQAELDRRGATMPELSLSAHAVDRASLRLRKKWHKTADSENEGLYSWLTRYTATALKDGEPDEEGVVIFDGIRFVFSFTGGWPELVTVMPAKKRERETE